MQIQLGLLLFGATKHKEKFRIIMILCQAEDIYNMPVNKIADDNCILFIWVTYPNLLEGLETIKRWGFTYKTCGFSWIKKNKKSRQFILGNGLLHQIQ